MSYNPLQDMLLSENNQLPGGNSNYNLCVFYSVNIIYVHDCMRLIEMGREDIYSLGCVHEFVL